MPESKGQKLKSEKSVDFTLKVGSVHKIQTSTSRQTRQPSLVAIDKTLYKNDRQNEGKN